MFKKIFTALCVSLLICIVPLCAHAETTDTVYAEAEPNNAKTTAEILYNGATYVGTITAGDVDYYKLTLTADSQAAVVTAADSKSVQFSIYDADDDLWGSSEYYGMDGGYYIQNAVEGLPKGTYYIVLESSDSSAESTYAISIAWESICPHDNVTDCGVVTEPTLTTEGERLYICEDCGEELREPVYAVAIETQPRTVFAKSGATVSTSVKATGEGLTYQWYVRDAGALDYTKSSVTSSTYATKMNNARKNRLIYCVITDKYGNSVQTKTVALRMAATITKQPTHASAAVGSVAKTKVTAVGDGLTYQWYLKNPGASKFSKSSVTSATYSVKMTAANDGRQVYCVVTDKYGKTATSDTVTLGLPVEITTQPRTVFAKSGATIKTTVTADGDGLTYTWYVRNAGASDYTKSSVTSSTYSTIMDNVRKDRLIYCVIEDQYGNSVQTKTVALRMAATITTQPKSVTVAEGSTAKATVKAAGDGLTYTWYYKNAGASKFSKTTSFTGTSYYVTMNAARDGRQIYCVVTDKYGKTAKSDVVTLNMK